MGDGLVGLGCIAGEIGEVIETGVADEPAAAGLLLEPARLAHPHRGDPRVLEVDVDVGIGGELEGVGESVDGVRDRGGVAAALDLALEPVLEFGDRALGLALLPDPEEDLGR